MQGSVLYDEGIFLFGATVSSAVRSTDRVAATVLRFEMYAILVLLCCKTFVIRERALLTDRDVYWNICLQ